MNDHDRRNPYSDLPLTRLSQVLSARAGGLLDGRQVGRRDTAHMLIVAARHLSPPVGMPGSAYVCVRDGESTPEAEYCELLEDEQRSLRWRLAQQAMHAARWPGEADRDRLAGRAWHSDAAFREVMQEIGAGIRNAVSGT